MAEPKQNNPPKAEPQTRPIRVLPATTDPVRFGLKPPPEFEASMDFCAWRRRAEFFLSYIPEVHRAAFLINLLSDNVQGIIFGPQIPSQLTLQEVWTKLEDVFAARTDPAQFARPFWDRVQHDDESVDSFADALRLLVNQAFPSLPDSQREFLVLQRFQYGLRDPHLIEKFTRKPAPSIQEALKRARSTPPPKTALPLQCLAVNQPGPSTRPLPAPRNPSTTCFKCGKSGHLARDCFTGRPKSNRFTTTNCPYCKRFGSKARACGHNRKDNTRTQAITYEPGKPHEELPIFIPALHNPAKPTLPLVAIQLYDKARIALVDTGSACTIVHSRCYPHKASLLPAHTFRAANGTSIRAWGTVDAKISIQGKPIRHSVFLSQEIPWDAILGVDLLKDHDICIDLASGTLTIQDQTVPLYHTPPKPPNAVFSQDVAQTNLASQIAAMVATSDPTATTLEKHKLQALIQKRAEAFAWEGQPIGRTHLLRHRIHTATATPIRQRPRRIPIQYQTELRQLIQQMLAQGIIKPSTSDWASPVVLVKKKTGALRLCVDYRKLNSVTKRDSFPLPRIDDIFDSLQGATWFATLDLASGYWQVELDPHDQEKTAFVIPSGLYEFTTMPFGLANAPATFQRLMQLVLQGLTPDTCLIYMDDVVVFGRTVDELISRLDGVLQRLIQAGLKLKPSKCILLRTQVKFLGHVVDRHGIHTDPDKVTTVQQWPTPTSATEVQQFLGLASYYRRFIRNFATIAAPLHRLTEKGRKFSWTTQCDQAFACLRQALTTAPVLSLPDVSENAPPFILDTDASDTGIGAVLSQRGPDNQEHVIAYASRTLTKPERNYCTTRKEMLALVTFIKLYRPYLLGKRFLIRTDHQALRWLQTFKEPEGQVARWQEALQQYNFECIHRPGAKHRNADTLSRRPQRQHGDCPSCDDRIAPISLTPTLTEDWAEIHRNDPETKLIYERLTTDGIKPTKEQMQGTSWEAHCLWSQWPRLQINDGILYLVFGGAHEPRLVIPQSHVQNILTTLHEQLGHAGQRKMDIAATQRYWWPHQRRDIVNFCNNCHDCLRIRPPQHALRAPMKPITTGYPNQLLGIDFVGPLPATQRGNRYILVMVDFFTKWCEAVPLPDATATTTAHAIFDQWIARFGAPEQLHSDRGSDFESRIIGELCQLLHIRKSRTTPYHPQGNGQVERTNRTLKALLKSFTDSYTTRDWDKALARCLLAYRATVHRSTGHSPHAMLTGREIRLPTDLTVPGTAPDPLLATDYAIRLQHDLRHVHQLARIHLQSAHRHQRDYYDQRAFGAPVRPGQCVYLRVPTPPPGVPAKLHKEWDGPFYVYEVYADTTCRIGKADALPSQTFTVHYNQLKLAPEHLSDSTLPPHLHSPPTIDRAVDGASLPGGGAV